MDTPPTYLTLQQAADRMSVCDKTVRRWIATGRITGYRAGNRVIRVRADELDALLRPIPSAAASL